MIEAFGYDRNDEEFEKILRLSQVTLSCTKEDLDRIIDFLNDVKSDIEKENIEEGDHWHYRDYYDSWTEEESDLIIFADNARG